MHVHICTVGERGEGYSIRKVYRDKSRALMWLEEQRTNPESLSSDNPDPIVQVTPDLVQFTVACDIYAVRTWRTD